MVKVIASDAKTATELIDIFTQAADSVEHDPILQGAEKRMAYVNALCALCDNVVAESEEVEND